MIEYLIIGGSTKCATTSLFNYLGDHPEICPAIYKETRFFLNPEYPVERRFAHTNSLSEYNNLFKIFQF